MKRILTIICAIAFSGVALSAQNNADNNCEKSQKPAYMINVDNPYHKRLSDNRLYILLLASD